MRVYRRLDWIKGTLQELRDYISFYGKEMNIINCEEYFFVRHRILSAIKGVEFVSGRRSYVVLRGCWCKIIVLNAHAPSEEKTDGSKTVFMRN